MKKVKVKWTPSATNAEQAARDLVSAVLYLHSTFKNEIWLWRGQANANHGLEPGMHTRVHREAEEDETALPRATDYLLKSARSAGVDRTSSDFLLPDLALLARLQHHGAATPLLDVTFDPLVALWFVAFADKDDPPKLDDTSGSLFAIRKPQPERQICPLDARPFWSDSIEKPSIDACLGEDIWGTTLQILPND